MTIEYKYKIILIGPLAVGKTSLMYRFVKNQFKDYRSTIGVEFMLHDLELNGNDVKLTIWDIGGHDRFKTLRKSYYINTKGALLIYDLTRENTFNELEQWYSEMVEILKEEIPFILVGNKVDLLEEKERCIDISRAKQFAKDRNGIYIETSAKTGEHVKDAFSELSNLMIQRYDDVIRVQD